MSDDWTIAVRLAPDELRRAVVIGVERRLYALREGRRPSSYGNPEGDRWGADIEGACAEAAVAKALNRYWSPAVGPVDRQSGDVGRLQVRGTKDHGNRLILHPDDADDVGYVLVTGTAPDYVLRGWIWGREGKDERYWCDPGTSRPAYFVPQERLRSMLKRRVATNIIPLRHTA